MGPTVYSLERAVQGMEAVGPIFLVLENTVEELETSVEEVETALEAVVGLCGRCRCWRRSSIITAQSTMMRWERTRLRLEMSLPRKQQLL